MVRTKDVIKTHQRIRDTIRTQPEFQELCTKTHTDARCVEQWVENVLREKDGPSKVVKVVYTDGPALEFLDFMTMIGGLTTKEQRQAFLQEKIPHLQALESENHAGRYYNGALRNDKGETSKSVLKQLTLTAAGKNQLLLNGNGAVEIALRDVVGRKFFERVLAMEEKEKQVRGDYNETLNGTREEGTALFHNMVEFQMDHHNVPEEKAKSIVRACTRTLYKPMVPDFKSAGDANLVANDKLSIQDALRCKEGREDELTISKEELQTLRKSYNCVSDQGTRIFHARLADMRFQAQVLMSEDGLSPKAAHDVVAKHVAESGMCIFKDKYDNPRPPEIQAKIYFNKEYDLDLFRAEHMPPAPAPVCTRPLPPSPPPPKAPPGQNIVQKRRQVLQLDPTPPLQMRACPTKKRRVSNVSASSGGGGAGDKGDPVTVKCVVNRKDWDKLPTFAQIAKYLAENKDGIAWRKANNISHVATANELLQWFKEANPKTPPKTTIFYQLKDKAELRVEP